MTDDPAASTDAFESRTERNVVLAGGVILSLGIVGFVAFAGGRGTGSAGEFLGRPGIDGVGMLVSVLLVLVGASVIYGADRIA